MFDRYTEAARRVIFYARYEASQLCSEQIDTEHLVLGLLHEDKMLKENLSSAKREGIRSQIETEFQKPGTKISTSVDLPLSEEAKRVLAFGAEEAQRLKHDFIGCGHLVLGLLRVPDCAGASILTQNGFNLADYRHLMALTGGGQGTIATARPVRPLERDNPWEVEKPQPLAPILDESIVRLTGLIDRLASHLNGYDEAYGDERLKRKPWTRKEAMGHLVDWTAVHQVWFARALTEPKVVASGYPGDEWVAAQGYNEFPWPDLVDLWVGANRLLVHILLRVPEAKVETPCRIGVEDPQPLAKLIARYVIHCEDIAGQLVARL